MECHMMEGLLLCFVNIEEWQYKLFKNELWYLPTKDYVLKEAYQVLINHPEVRRQLPLNMKRYEDKKKENEEAGVEKELILRQWILSSKNLKMYIIDQFQQKHPVESIEKWNYHKKFQVRFNWPAERLYGARLKKYLKLSKQSKNSDGSKKKKRGRPKGSKTKKGGAVEKVKDVVKTMKASKKSAQVSTTSRKKKSSMVIDEVKESKGLPEAPSPSSSHDTEDAPETSLSLPSPKRIALPRGMVRKAEIAARKTDDGQETSPSRKKLPKGYVYADEDEEEESDEDDDSDYSETPEEGPSTSTPKRRFPVEAKSVKRRCLEKSEGDLEPTMLTEGSSFSSSYLPTLKDNGQGKSTSSVKKLPKGYVYVDEDEEEEADDDDDSETRQDLKPSTSSLLPPRYLKRTSSSSKGSEMVRKAGNRLERTADFDDGQGTSSSTSSGRKLPKGFVYVDEDEEEEADDNEYSENLHEGPSTSSSGRQLPTNSKSVKRRRLEKAAEKASDPIVATEAPGTSSSSSSLRKLASEPNGFEKEPEVKKEVEADLEQNLSSGVGTGLDEVQDSTSAVDNELEEGSSPLPPPPVGTSSDDTTVENQEEVEEPGTGTDPFVVYEVPETSESYSRAQTSSALSDNQLVGSAEGVQEEKVTPADSSSPGEQLQEEPEEDLIIYASWANDRLLDVAADLEKSRPFEEPIKSSPTEATSSDLNEAEQNAEQDSEVRQKFSSSLLPAPKTRNEEEEYENMGEEEEDLRIFPIPRRPATSPPSVSEKQPLTVLTVTNGSGSVLETENETNQEFEIDHEQSEPAEVNSKAPSPSLPSSSLRNTLPTNSTLSDEKEQEDIGAEDADAEQEQPSFSQDSSTPVSPSSASEEANPVPTLPFGDQEAEENPMEADTADDGDTPSTSDHFDIQHAQNLVNETSQPSTEKDPEQPEQTCVSQDLSTPVIPSPALEEANPVPSSTCGDQVADENPMQTETADDGDTLSTSDHTAIQNAQEFSDETSQPLTEEDTEQPEQTCVSQETFSGMEEEAVEQSEPLVVQKGIDDGHQLSQNGEEDQEPSTTLGAPESAPSEVPYQKQVELDTEDKEVNTSTSVDDEGSEKRTDEASKPVVLIETEDNSQVQEEVERDQVMLTTSGDAHSSVPEALDLISVEQETDDKEAVTSTSVLEKETEKVLESEEVPIEMDDVSQLQQESDEGISSSATSEGPETSSSEVLDLDQKRVDPEDMEVTISTLVDDEGSLKKTDEASELVVAIEIDDDSEAHEKVEEDQERLTSSGDLHVPAPNSLDANDVDQEADDKEAITSTSGNDDGLDKGAQEAMEPEEIPIETRNGSQLQQESEEKMSPSATSKDPETSSSEIQETRVEQEAEDKEVNTSTSVDGEASEPVVPIEIDDDSEMHEKVEEDREVLTTSENLHSSVPEVSDLISVKQDTDHNKATTSPFVNSDRSKKEAEEVWKPEEIPIKTSDGSSLQQESEKGMSPSATSKDPETSSSEVLDLNQKRVEPDSEDMEVAISTSVDDEGSDQKTDGASEPVAASEIDVVSEAHEEVEENQEVLTTSGALHSSMPEALDQISVEQEADDKEPVISTFVNGDGLEKEAEKVLEPKEIPIEMGDGSRLQQESEDGMSLSVSEDPETSSSEVQEPRVEQEIEDKDEGEREPDQIVTHATDSTSLNANKPEKDDEGEVSVPENYGTSSPRPSSPPDPVEDKEVNTSLSVDGDGMKKQNDEASETIVPIEHEEVEEDQEVLTTSGALHLSMPEVLDQNGVQQEADDKEAVISTSVNSDELKKEAEEVMDPKEIPIETRDGCQLQQKNEDGMSLSATSSEVQERLIEQETEDQDQIVTHATDSTSLNANEPGKSVEEVPAPVVVPEDSRNSSPPPSSPIDPVVVNQAVSEKEDEEQLDPIAVAEIPETSPMSPSEESPMDTSSDDQSLDVVEQHLENIVTTFSSQQSSTLNDCPTSPSSLPKKVSPFDLMTLDENGLEAEADEEPVQNTTTGRPEALPSSLHDTTSPNDSAPSNKRVMEDADDSKQSSTANDAISHSTSLSKSRTSREFTPPSKQFVKDWNMAAAPSDRQETPSPLLQKSCLSTDSTLAEKQHLEDTMNSEQDSEQHSTFSNQEEPVKVDDETLVAEAEQEVERQLNSNASACDREPSLSPSPTKQRRLSNSAPMSDSGSELVDERNSEQLVLPNAQVILRAATVKTCSTTLTSRDNGIEKDSKQDANVPKEIADCQDTLSQTSSPPPLGEHSQTQPILPNGNEQESKSSLGQLEQTAGVQETSSSTSSPPPLEKLSPVPTDKCCCEQEAEENSERISSLPSSSVIQHTGQLTSLPAPIVIPSASSELSQPSPPSFSVESLLVPKKDCNSQTNEKKLMDRSVSVTFDNIRQGEPLSLMTVLEHFAQGHVTKADVKVFESKFGPISEFGLSTIHFALTKTPQPPVIRLHIEPNVRLPKADWLFPSSKDVSHCQTQTEEPQETEEVKLKTSPGTSSANDSGLKSVPTSSTCVSGTSASSGVTMRSTVPNTSVSAKETRSEGIQCSMSATDVSADVSAELRKLFPDITPPVLSLIEMLATANADVASILSKINGPSTSSSTAAPISLTTQKRAYRRRKQPSEPTDGIVPAKKPRASRKQPNITSSVAKSPVPQVPSFVPPNQISPHHFLQQQQPILHDQLIRPNSVFLNIPTMDVQQAILAGQPIQQSPIHFNSPFNMQLPTIPQNQQLNRPLLLKALSPTGSVPQRVSVPPTIPTNSVTPNLHVPQIPMYPNMNPLYNPMMQLLAKFSTPMLPNLPHPGVQVLGPPQVPNTIPQNYDPREPEETINIMN